MIRAYVQLARGVFFALALILAGSLSAQTPPERATPIPPPVPAVPKPAYPDSTSGLEHLAKDILKAQAQNDASHADALLQSLTLQEAHDWYDRSFGPEAAHGVGEYYENTASSIAPYLARTFLDAQKQDFSRVQALRYEHSCDDNAAEEAYGVLLRRSEPFPIYELRFLNADRFIRVFPIAYVDGAFRFFLSPDFRPPASPQKTSSADKNSTSPEQAHAGSQKTPPADKDSTSPKQAHAVRRIMLGGNFQAARLIKRVQPVYPERARSERVSGTVKIHAVIGKDGQPSRILGVRGVCSLAESAVAAVRQWRYQPTLLNGEPVEVETEIDVVYSLGQ